MAHDDHAHEEEADGHDDHAHEEEADGHDDHAHEEEADGHDDHAHEEADGHDDHGHDDHGHDHAHGTGAGWEWAGAFRVTAGMYTYVAYKNSGIYGHGDSSMRLYFAFSDHLDGEKAIESLELAAQIAFSECAYTIDAHANNVSMVLEEPKVNSTAYMLHFDTQSPMSLWKLSFETTEEATVVLFFAHSPHEFEGSSHYLQDSEGNDVEASAEMPKEEGPQADWERTLAATFLVAFISLAGLLTAVPALSAVTTASIPYLSAFAGGTLLATAFFLLFGEAMEYIKTEWPKETDSVWRWGTVIMAGYTTCVLFDLIARIVSSRRISCLSGDKGAPEGAKKGAEPMAPVEPTVIVGVCDVPTGIARPHAETAEDLESGEPVVSAGFSWASFTDLSKAQPLAVHIIFGDFFHNLADGFLIAAAFKSCSASTGWTVTYATLAHEFVQELADFFVLITTGNLTHAQAAVGNFISQMGVVFGGIIMCSVDVTEEELGYVLGFGGGVYLYVALTECVPRFLHSTEVMSSWKSCVIGVFAFLLGMVALGLILLDHEHCAAGDSHEGHGH
ncbi:hypothetical protein CYMTET_36692 [Cymbomonas tetramitiformis]|uniref:Uncharacterized protein n=1 Tax=Cymbomonas tetramitiformis TaxID=36881 RepID=A0AAE0F771_9CHLO|nr:hypothetical protein CYMTET_36692 [Cymbomonas tetramitiformis]